MQEHEKIVDAEGVILSGKTLDDAVKQYLVDHKAEVDAMIDKKIEVAIKREIRDAFSVDRNGKQGIGALIVHQRVTEAVVDASKYLKIDEQELRSELDRKLSTAIKRVGVNLTHVK